ncbi:hypothetical protein FUMI01_01880 [Flavobacterium sp. UMI-01]|nr:hypothetical protein FUMI01_01880 [Flavobacterium sp. UMI-01]
MGLRQAQTDRGDGFMSLYIDNDYVTKLLGIENESSSEEKMQLFSIVRLS